MLVRVGMDIAMAVQTTINQTKRREQPSITCLALSFGENVIISVDTAECRMSLLGQNRS